MISGVTMKRCGISVNQKSLVLIYGEGLKTRKRSIHIPQLDSLSVVETYAELLADEHHSQFVNLIPKAQVLRLLSILKNVCSGMTLTDALERSKELDSIIGDEALHVEINGVDDNGLEGKKAVMDNLFTQNRVPPKESDFIYDKEVDLPEGSIETYSWDSDECEF
ncbi:unnamed protein product [Heterobilharzia americana]|nr:unnamed protein product [Heterobilharzia americana]